MAVFTGHRTCLVPHYLIKRTFFFWILKLFRATWLSIKLSHLSVLYSYIEPTAGTSLRIHKVCALFQIVFFLLPFAFRLTRSLVECYKKADQLLFLKQDKHPQLDIYLCCGCLYIISLIWNIVLTSTLSFLLDLTVEPENQLSREANVVSKKVFFKTWYQSEMQIKIQTNSFTFHHRKMIY